MKVSNKEIQFKSYKDLAPFGINPLTGEACAYSLRILCDLSSEGRELMAEFLGISAVGISAPNWNSQVNGKEAVRSIMISRSTFEDLYKYLCWREGCKYIVVVPRARSYTGYKELTEEEVEFFRQDGFELYQSPVIPSQPSVNGRNAHAMTGRTE